MKISLGVIVFWVMVLILFLVSKRGGPLYVSTYTECRVAGGTLKSLVGATGSGELLCWYRGTPIDSHSNTVIIEKTSQLLVRIPSMSMYEKTVSGYRASGSGVNIEASLYITPRTLEEVFNTHCLSLGQNSIRISVPNLFDTHRSTPGIFTKKLSTICAVIRVPQPQLSSKAIPDMIVLTASGSRVQELFENVSFVTDHRVSS